MGHLTDFLLTHVHHWLTPAHGIPTHIGVHTSLESRRFYFQNERNISQAPYIYVLQLDTLPYQSHSSRGEVVQTGNTSHLKGIAPP